MTARLCACGFFAAFLCAQNSAFRLAGIVVNGLTGAPMPRVRVSLAPYRQPGQFLAPEDSVVTSADGRFSFQAPEGKFTLTAERNGWPRQKYFGDAPSSGFGISVVTGSDQSTGALRFRYYPPGAISGRVRDDAGEPVENALVQLLRRSVVAGRTRVATVAWFYTNDLGEFRFPQLPAGNYYLAVTSNPWYGKETAYPPVYYPSAQEMRSAEAIPLKAGDEAVANFSVHPIPGATLTLHIEGLTGGGIVNLLSEGIGGSDGFERSQSVVGPHSIIEGVPPGDYRLRLYSGTGPTMRVAAQTVHVSAGQQAVNLVLSAPPDVSGTLQLEDDRDRVDLPRILVTLFDEASNRGQMRAPSPDGSFSLAGLPPGKYRVRLSSGYFADRVTVNGRLAAENMVDLTGESPPTLRIVAAKGAGRVRGFVTRDGKPFAGALVVLAPRSLAADPGLYRGFQTDSDGSFNLENLRPGDYSLFAVEDSDFEYANPEPVRPFLLHAKSLRIDAGTTYSERLDLP